MSEGATWECVAWDYTEQLIIDRETETLEHIQNIGTGCKVSRKYEIEGGIVGVRMQLLEYMGETKTAKSVLQQYQYVMYDFLTKPITKKGLTTAALMHDYFPYDNSNMNCWYNFKKEMQPALESGIKSLELSMNGTYNNEVYVVSVEDIDDEEKE